MGSCQLDGHTRRRRCYVDPFRKLVRARRHGRANLRPHVLQISPNVLGAACGQGFEGLRIYRDQRRCGCYPISAEVIVGGPNHAASRRIHHADQCHCEPPRENPSDPLGRARSIVVIPRCGILNIGRQSVPVWPRTPNEDPPAHVPDAPFFISLRLDATIIHDDRERSGRCEPLRSPKGDNRCASTESITCGMIELWITYAHE